MRRVAVWMFFVTAAVPLLLTRTTTRAGFDVAHELHRLVQVVCSEKDCVWLCVKQQMH